MSATNVEEAFSADPFELRFSSFYGMKDFLKDACRLRDLNKLRGREKLSEAELAEVPELRRRLRRADADSVLLMLRGGYNFF